MPIFRYTGRTQKEIVEFVRENYVKRQSFQRFVASFSLSNAANCFTHQLSPLPPLCFDRSQSFRHASPQNTSASGVGNSLSVHPLLPVGDNVIGMHIILSLSSVLSPSLYPGIKPVYLILLLSCLLMQWLVILCRAVRWSSRHQIREQGVRLRRSGLRRWTCTTTRKSHSRPISIGKWIRDSM